MKKGRINELIIVACARCHKIRNAHDNWDSTSPEMYDALMKFYPMSHGYCDVCIKNEFPDYKPSNKV